MPTRESLVSDIAAGDGKIANLFFLVYFSVHKLVSVKGKSKSQNWLNQKIMIVLIFSVLKFFLSCIPSRELLFYRVRVICLWNKYLLILLFMIVNGNQIEMQQCKFWLYLITEPKCGRFIQDMTFCDRTFYSCIFCIPTLCTCQQKCDYRTKMRMFYPPFRIFAAENFSGLLHLEVL